MSCRAMGTTERRLAKDQKYVSEFPLLMVEAEVLVKVEGPNVLVNKHDILRPKHTEDFAPAVAEDVDAERGPDVGTGLEVGGSSFTAEGFDFLASTPDLVSSVGGIWLTGGLAEDAARSEAFRDVTELELALGDILCDTFFSTERPFPVVPPG